MDLFIRSPHSTGIPPIDFSGELNEEQFEAVTAPAGPVLVLAGAGSGKTRTLTYRVAWLLSNGVAPWEILLLTFTNKAAREMLHRVEELTGVESGKFWGGTFHHIGHRLLRRHAQDLDLDRNFTILDADESEHLLKKAVTECDKDFFKDKSHPKAGVLSAIISLSRNTRKPLESTIQNSFGYHAHLTDRILAHATQYLRLKRSAKVVDYDDLLDLWLRLLEQFPETAQQYAERFRHCLVDEYQDTNSLQARIIDLIAPHHRIMAVGDDAQCIYSWRGADFSNIMTFPERHPGTHICRIETNYRSSPQILDLANAVLRFQPLGSGYEKTLRPFRPPSEPPFVVACADTEQQASFVTGRVQALLEDGRAPGEIAILYRAHYQAIEIQMYLTRAGIQFMITSGVRFFEQAHVKDILCHLRLLANPGDQLAFLRLTTLLPRIGDKGADKLHALVLEEMRASSRDLPEAGLAGKVLAKVPSDAQADWNALFQTLADMRDSGQSGGPAEMVQMALEGWYGGWIKGAYPNYESRVDDLQALAGFASRYTNLNDFLAEVTLQSGEGNDRSSEDRRDCIRLTTIHQAKGLEFDVVFVIGLADGLFPLRRAVEAGDTEEERRLFYVSITRAREELYLSYPRFQPKGGNASYLQPSRFVQELPQHLYENVRLRRTY